MGAFKDLAVLVQDYVNKHYAGEEMTKNMLMDEITEHIHGTTDYFDLSYPAQRILDEWENNRMLIGGIR